MLKIDNLSKRFSGLVAVDRLSFTVESGTITALIGPNGAGKTTALNLISGVLRPTGGQISLKETDITGWGPHDIARLGMSRTYQNLQMFLGMSVLETVMVGAHRKGRSYWLQAMLRLPGIVSEEADLEAASRRALDRAGIPTTYFERVAADLPYGWQRRVEIARAIASEPDVVLLDEPAAGLNNRESEDMAQLILSLRDSGTTVLLVEHDMNLVMGISDHVVVMNFGRLICADTPRAVQRNQAVIEAYLGSEMEQIDAVG